MTDYTKPPEPGHHEKFTARFRSGRCTLCVAVVATCALGIKATDLNTWAGAYGTAFLGARPGQRRVIVQPADSAPRPNQLPDCIFMPSPQKVIDTMLKLAKVQPGEVLFDLGCGDGRICIAAAKKYRARTYGYEIDADLVKAARENVKKNKVEDLVTIEHRDIFKLDLSGADVITLWLLPYLNAKLIPQLEKMKPGSRIVSHDFEMLDIVKPDASIDVKAVNADGLGGRDRKIYLWKTPLKKDEKLFRELFPRARRSKE